MKNHKRDEGYTLIELILVIAIIAVAISMTSFGIGSLYSSNVKNFSSQVVSQIRNVQVKELASKDSDYEMAITKVGSKYQANTTMKADIDGDGVDEIQVIHSIEFPSNISIKKLVGASYFEISTLTPSEVEFAFDPSSGALITSGNGTYRMSLVDSSTTIEFEVVAQNGRVYTND